MRASRARIPSAQSGRDRPARVMPAAVCNPPMLTFLHGRNVRKCSECGKSAVDTSKLCLQTEHHSPKFQSLHAPLELAICVEK